MGSRAGLQAGGCSAAGEAPYVYGCEFQSGLVVARNQLSAPFTNAKKRVKEAGARPMLRRAANNSAQRGSSRILVWETVVLYSYEYSVPELLLLVRTITT